MYRDLLVLVETRRVRFLGRFYMGELGPSRVCDGQKSVIPMECCICRLYEYVSDWKDKSQFD